MSWVDAVLAIIGAGIVFGFGCGIGLRFAHELWPMSFTKVNVYMRKKEDE